ncbi:MAG TPA: cytochrome c, partial [Burkholderiaceae bacterium]|nr:cytochrome c [Burkholderiaceae bacterium]
FTKDAVPACAVCHTLRDAGATGTVGPVLDELKPDAARVEAALRLGSGQMPSYLGKLEDSQIVALAVYVATVAGAGK